MHQSSFDAMPVSMHDLFARKDPDFKGHVKWTALTRFLVFKVFFKHPDRDFLITPHTLMETGDIKDSRHMDPAFDCPILPTAIKRNLFRLYATIVYLLKGIQLGLPAHPLSKLRAIQHGHPLILEQMVGKDRDDSEFYEALVDIYSLLFKDFVEHPSDGSPLTKDII